MNSVVEADFYESVNSVADSSDARLSHSLSMTNCIAPRIRDKKMQVTAPRIKDRKMITTATSNKTSGHAPVTAEDLSRSFRDLGINLRDTNGNEIYASLSANGNSADLSSLLDEWAIKKDILGDQVPMEILKLFELFSEGFITAEEFFKRAKEHLQMVTKSKNYHADSSCMLLPWTPCSLYASSQLDLQFITDNTSDGNGELSLDHFVSSSYK